MTSAGYVEFRWGRDDGDGIGSLRVIAEASGFRGDGAAWFDRGEVLGFADRLDEFPVSVSDPPSLQGGYDHLAGDDLHVGLQLVPVGSSGQVGFGVELGGDPTSLPRHFIYRARLEVPVTYEGLSHLGTDLRHLIEGTVDVARIDEDVLIR